MSKSTFVEGVGVVLLKQKGGWSFFTTFPPGATVPANSLPTGKHFKPTLAEALNKITEHFVDDALSGGHPPAADPHDVDPEQYPFGTLIWITRRAREWMPVAHYPGGGISQRSAGYSSLADCFEGFRLLHAET